MSNDLWAIQANVQSGVRDSDGNVWEGTRQLPTFYLNPRVQGILTDTYAIELAGRILDNLGLYVQNGAHLSISAELVQFVPDRLVQVKPDTQPKTRPEVTDKVNHDVDTWHVEVDLKDAETTNYTVMSFDVAVSNADAGNAIDIGRMRSHAAALYAGAYLATLGYEPHEYRLRLLEARQYGSCCDTTYQSEA